MCAKSFCTKFTIGDNCSSELCLHGYQPVFDVIIKKYWYECDTSYWYMTHIFFSQYVMMHIQREPNKLLLYYRKVRVHGGHPFS